MPTEIEVVWDDVENLTGKAAPVINKEKTLLGYNKPVEPESGQQAKSHQQSPKNIPPVYDGSQLLVFGMFHDKLPTAVLIKAQSPDGPLTLKIEVLDQCFVLIYYILMGVYKMEIRNSNPNL